MYRCAGQECEGRSTAFDTPSRYAFSCSGVEKRERPVAIVRSVRDPQLSGRAFEHLGDSRLQSSSGVALDPSCDAGVLINNFWTCGRGIPLRSLLDRDRRL